MAMLEPYRRDSVSKALFAWGGVLAGATYVTIWLRIDVPVFLKLVTGLALYILFMVAWYMCPPKAPGKED